MRTAGVIVAAGAGIRAGGEIPKQYKMLLGKPVIAWSIEAMQAAGAFPIVIVIAPEHGARVHEIVRASDARVAYGGATRTASVRAGLAALAEAAPDAVLIHDAARPGASAALMRRLIDKLEQGADAIAPALPLPDALRLVDADNRVVGQASRENLMRVQTPQGFRYNCIVEAYAVAGAHAAFEDDLAVARNAGIEAVLIPGDARALKLTYNEDFATAEKLMSDEHTICVGSGFDAHRFGDGDHVMLCGVRIAHDKGLIGHSDADAGWHALVDAILGALGCGDIGAHFPPRDPKWAGASSEIFLRHARDLAEAESARIQHVDITLICERPKIGPHREAMRTRTAEVLGLPLERVSIKATTTERLGFLGREEGLAAQALATVLRLL